MAWAEAEKKNMAAKAEAAVRKMTEGATSLSLQRASIGDKGTAKIAKELGKNATVEGIYLDRNQITDKGAANLAGALRENITLKVLYLGQNQITDEGAARLAGALRENATLTYLNLDGNPMSVAGKQAVFDLVKQNKEDPAAAQACVEAVAAAELVPPRV